MKQTTQRYSLAPRIIGGLGAYLMARTSLMLIVGHLTPAIVYVSMAVGLVMFAYLSTVQEAR